MVSDRATGFKVNGIHDPFKEMQKAVDIADTSLHPVNKIAATLFGVDVSGISFSVSRTNFWPEVIAEKLGIETRIGEASGSVHAETACIMAAPFSDGASMCVTDPFCPDCAKNIVDAGVRTVYIDHDGFEKDFISRRGDAFKIISLKICEQAGVDVFELDRGQGSLVPILQNGLRKRPDHAVVRELPLAGDFHAAVRTVQEEHSRIKIAVAQTSAGSGICFVPAPEADERTSGGKYSIVQEPLTGAFMHAARRGVKLLDGFVYVSHVPSAREQVNMVGAGHRRVYVGDMASGPDEQSFAAMRLLQEKKVLAFLPML